MPKHFKITFQLSGTSYQFQVSKLPTHKELKIERWLVWNDSIELELESNRPAIVHMHGARTNTGKWTVIKGEIKPENLLYSIIEQINKNVDN